MRRFLPRTLNQWLLAAIPLSLLLAWVLNHWIFGSAAALGALCVLAVRNPKLETVLEGLPLWSRVFARHTSAQDDAAQPRRTLNPPPRRVPKRDKAAPLSSQLLEQGRVALLLRPQVAASLSEADLTAAQDALDEAMAIVPEGQVAMRSRTFDQHEDTLARAERLIQVEGFFLDRFCVTNQEYAQFVDDGGYEQMSLWDESIWPAVLGFVDQTGQPGPRYWEHGAFPPERADHPVVGVSWYEACAYARWAGKRLPTDPEWVKASTWPVFTDGAKPIQRRFPWGDAMDRKRVNVWGSGFDNTIPVHALPNGSSVNGVQQLIGNVWEWTSSTFGAWEPATRKIETGMPLKSIRGAAFDSYFDTQAHCQFQSGESPLSRKHNVGFRCSLGFCDVVYQADAGLPSIADQDDDRDTGSRPTPSQPEEVLA